MTEMDMVGVSKSLKIIQNILLKPFNIYLFFQL